MLKINNITKHYDQFTLNCSMDLQPGTITGLIGQNGAGKSTTFKAILDLIKIDSGNVEIFGKDSRNLTLQDKEKIGVILSDSGFSDYFTIQDLIPMLNSFYKDFNKNEFLTSCQKFGLPLNKKIKEFSTGMKAKIKAIVALSHKAKLLILDEPTAGLDVIARDELLNILREYMEKNEETTILISSHISTDLEGLCDDIYMIHEGKIILHEETDVLLSDYALLKVDDDQYNSLDKQHILKRKKESYGYSCLTNQRQFYLDNYPSISIEKGNIDEVIMLMVKGE